MSVDVVLGFVANGEVHGYLCQIQDMANSINLIATSRGIFVVLFRSLFLAVVAVLLFAAPAQGADTPGVVDQTTGTWTLLDGEGDPSPIGFGNPADVPFMGDWDCDGIDTPGLYRRSDGFAYLRNSNTTGVADVTFLFGVPGDLPLPGDFDGDGCDTLSLYRPSEARFYVINELGQNGGGLGAADYSFLFGNPGDVPFMGDWNGDNIDTPGLRRPSNGFVYLRNSNTTGVGDVSYFYGDPGDLPFAGDWDGDGDDTLGLFRPSTGTVYLRNTNSTGVAHSTACIGQHSSVPVAGDFGPVSGPTTARIALQLVNSGLDRPLFVSAPPGDCRLFVVEQTGDIEILSGWTRLSSPFLEVVVTGFGERGLLGLAFHPDYSQNGKFYVNYTIGSVTRISEFRVSSDPNRADPSSERVLLEVTQPFTNHNGGMLAFDESGFLLIALGDGGGGGDPGNRAQNPNNLLGKILRIDVDGGDVGGRYSIPPGNPFASGGGAPEVFLIGLRNPWRFDIDEGLGYIADVGQEHREEITVISMGSGGADLGWNTWEGTRCFDPPCTGGGFVFPQIEYSHLSGCSVTGGYVYRGRAISGLAGAYFYGDLCSGWISSFRYEGGEVVDQVDRTPQLGTVGSLSSFGLDGFGEIYVTSLQSGRVLKIVPAP